MFKHNLFLCLFNHLDFCEKVVYLCHDKHYDSIKKGVSMKKVLVIALLLLFYLESNGQIKLSTQAEKQEEEVAFDDSKNWQGEQYRSYIGQSLYVVPKTEKLVQYGYSGFFLKPDGDVYEPMSSSSRFNPKTKHEALANKTLIVEDVVISGKDYLGKPNVYLKLTLDADTLYFKYDLMYEHNFPFIVMSYLDRLQKDNIGKQFVMKKVLDKTTTDYVTGKEVVYIPGSIWTCTDIVLDTKYYNLTKIFTNDKEETISGFEALFILKEYKESLEKIYGKKLVQEAINGNIKIGMPKELVIVSWGKPDDINYSSYGEQWVYSGQYVYIEKGKVTGWN